MTVNPNLPVSITILASSNPFCQGSPVTFTATPVNEGALPIYQWKVNGVNAGTNSPAFTYNPLGGDQVSCILTSSIPCPVSNPVTSNTLLMTVNNNLPAGVTNTASTNPFCPGSPSPSQRPQQMEEQHPPTNGKSTGLMQAQTHTCSPIIL